MAISITAAIVWLNVEHGGNARLPIVGMRSSIRFQKDVVGWLKCMWSVQIAGLDLDPKGRTGTAVLKFSSQFSRDSCSMESGDLIELLDGYRVIGIGKISNIKTELHE